ncbi:pentatricopeptide repeat-containing protein At5g14080 [Magnolia sinica]|uniref:pentatricopeptide repeat-containing protein At5g14080 n=1 Tax=Magnolia sinica TaxID=86752 RepID=UPI00265ADFA4|nr:pentatricopeptide repeat-containing protein At5g14080 [Magnolia sinica]
MIASPSAAAAKLFRRSLIAPSIRPPLSSLSFLHHPFSSSSSHTLPIQSLNPLPSLIKTHKSPLSPTLHRSAIAASILHQNPTRAFFSFIQLTLCDRWTDPTTSNSLLAALSSNGHFEFSKIVFDTMVFRKTALSNVGFGVFTNAFSRVMELEKILHLLDETKDRMEGINGSVIAFSIVDSLCRASRFSDASQALEDLRCRGCKPDFMAYWVIIQGFRSIGRVDEVVSISKRKRKLGVAPRMNEYAEYIYGLISEGMIREAKELGEAIVGGDFPINDDVLNALISSVSSVEPNAAIAFLKYMVQKERFPTLSTLRDLSRNLCRNGEIDEMWGVFRILDSKSYFSDLEHYNLMVSFLCTAGRVKEAYSVLKEMRKNSCGPDVSIYNSVMEACCREDLLRPAKKLWDEMFANGCKGNLQTYNILIGKFSEMGEVEEANHLFHHMLEKGVQPDSMTYTSIIEGLCREGMVDLAYEIFNSSLEQDIVLDGSTLNTLVLSICKQGHFIAASKVMRGLAPSNIDSFRSHIVLLKSFAEAGEIDMAIDHIKWIQDTSPLKSGAITSELIASLSSSSKPEPVLQLLHKMKERGLASEDYPWVDLCKESFEW